ncbi:hypothetical protein B0H11DRAFT_1914923 [Mycena galericulata]|nr:hypothetical protein B0H11DRAFT_1914923 [Mycena galericulata]
MKETGALVVKLLLAAGGVVLEESNPRAPSGEMIIRNGRGDSEAPERCQHEEKHPNAHAVRQVWCWLRRPRARTGAQTLCTIISSASSGCASTLPVTTSQSAMTLRLHGRVGVAQVQFRVSPSFSRTKYLHLGVRRLGASQPTNAGSMHPMSAGAE